MPDQIFEHIVRIDFEDRVRLQNYLLGVFPMLQTNSSVKKVIKKGLITVNGFPASTAYYVNTGDIIQLEEPERQIPQFLIDIPLVFEDNHIAIIQKPAGTVCSGNKSKTIASQLYHILKPTTLDDRLFDPLLVHRLDRATSGLMIVAKTQASRIKLGNMLEQSLIEKHYIAIVEGHLEAEIKHIELPIEGKSALTYILSTKNLNTKDATSLVRVKIITGRTHQIRKHLTYIGHPLVGDQLYNTDGLSFGRGLFLSAIHLKFEHPINGEHMEFSIKPPKKFRKYIDK